MTELRTDYKEDILETSQQGKRTFNIVSKTGEILYEDVHIEDVSKYTRVGDEYGQEIINAQNEAINEVSKGSGLVFDTYQDYLDAKAQGEVSVGNTIYIKEGNQSEITAEQIVYNNSNVKLALDSLSTHNTNIKAGVVTVPAGNGSTASVTFSSPMPNTNYAVVFGNQTTSTYHHMIPASTTKTVNGFTVTHYDTGGSVPEYDSIYMWVAIPYKS